MTIFSIHVYKRAWLPGVLIHFTSLEVFLNQGAWWVRVWSALLPGPAQVFYSVIIWKSWNVKSQNEKQYFHGKNNNSWNEHSGIGLHTAKKLVASGATVLLHARFPVSLWKMQTVNLVDNYYIKMCFEKNTDDHPEIFIQDIGKSWSCNKRSEWVRKGKHVCQKISTQNGNCLTIVLAFRTSTKTFPGNSCGWRPLQYIRSSAPCRAGKGLSMMNMGTEYHCPGETELFLFGLFHL